MKTGIKRETSLDLLRLLACFMVVLLHVAASRWYSADVNADAWKVFNLYDSAARSSVPLFLMMSGRLFLSREELPSGKQLFTKYILKLVVLYVLWGLFFAVDTLGIHRIREESIAPIVKSFISRPKFHLWYLPSLVGIYFLMPILWSVCKYQGGRYLGYACAMFFVFGVLWSTVVVFFPKDDFTVLIGRFSYVLSEYSGYFLLGHYLSKKNFSKVKPWWLIAAFIVIVLAATKIGELDAIEKGKPSNLLYGNFTLPVFLEAVALYIVFLKLNVALSPGASQFLAAASRSTLFVYLFHPFVIEHLNIWFGVHTESFLPLLSVPLISVLVYAVCMLIAQVLLRIPVINKWLL